MPKPIQATRITSLDATGRSTSSMRCSTASSWPMAFQAPAEVSTARLPNSLRNFLRQGDKGLTRFIGSEGVIDFSGNGFTIHHSKMPKAPGYGGWDSFETYPEAMQKEIASQYDQQYRKEDRTVTQAKDISHQRRHRRYLESGNAGSDQRVAGKEV